MNAKPRQLSRTWARAARRASRAALLMAATVFTITLLPFIILGLVANVLSNNAIGQLPMDATASFHHLSPRPA